MVYVAADERRRAILAAARRVCDRDGLIKMSTRAVAREAGIPLGTLQHVFPTHADLLRAIIEDVDDEINTALRATPPGTAGLAATLRAGITTFWAEMVAGREGRDLQVLQYELTLTTLRAKGPYGIAAWQYDRYAELLAQWFRETVEASEASGEAPPAMGYEALARMVLAVVDGLILQYVVKPDPVRAAEDLETAITMLAAAIHPQ